ncbi:MAG: extracellular solute-binding protein [Lachnospiraceae bacterium]|nr:extracellular solute-binding protein [Butyrivibrio sp.]MCM1344534.1 extracellular solute-binding protein [Muribaculaceae bacterium]MCM1409354.1 extracellular solute-binding protein [Lachnospiraceae bacterium]
MKNRRGILPQHKNTAFWSMTGGILLALAACLSACGEAPQEPEAEPAGPTGIMIPMATFQEVRPDIQGMSENAYCWIGDSIYYSEWERPEEGGPPRNTIYREAVDGSEKETIDAQDDRLIYALFTDNAGNLGFIGCEHAEAEAEYFLIREDLAGQEISRVPIKLQGDPSDILESAMDPDGNVLYVTQEGKAYLLDAEGKSLEVTGLGMRQPEILYCGEQGLYLYQHEAMGAMPLRKVDLATGTIQQLKDLWVETDLRMEEGNIIALGSQEGILLSSENTLWSYDPDTGTWETILSWLGPEVNIQGNNVCGIRFGDTLEDGSRELEVLLDGYDTVVPEVAKITWVDQAYVPARQDIVAGVSYYFTQEDAVRRFNRSNTQYRVVLKRYDTSTMLDDLILHPEEVPDVLDIRGIVPDVLVNKGLLEDLEPYFQKSEIVKKEDILPAVWEAGKIGGIEAGAVTDFRIQTYWTTVPDFPRDGWDIEDFFALAQEYPDRKMLSSYTPAEVMDVFANTTLNDFVDWKKGKCSFDSAEFVNLLERIAALEYPPEDNIPIDFLEEDEVVRKFLTQEYLLKLDGFGSPFFYQRHLGQYGNKAYNIGYPSEDGPQYLMNASQQLAIYRNSECKEGAWAFIEFLLSEQEQTWYGDKHSAFPVRKDAFEAYLARPYSASNNVRGDDPGAGAEDLAYMAEHMHPMGSISRSELWTIIQEEVPYLFEGDKDAREVAEVIQNRASLYLKENR